MVLLIDTDVLIDFALDRQPHSTEASELLDWVEQRADPAFVAWHTLSNFYYLVAPKHGYRSTRDFLVDLTRFVQVAPTTTESLRYAAQLPMRDFEDALQVAAAVACHAEVIATRNLRDYARSPVRARKPSTILQELQSS